MKSNSATLFCKVCFRNITNQTLAALIGNNSCICQKCWSEMNPQITHFKIDEFPVTSCYFYNEKIQEMLYTFKGCFDYELGDLFLVNQKAFFELLYHSFYLVPSPSFSDRDAQRGFNHVEVIFKGIGKGFVHAIKKTDDVKQADLNARGRNKIGEHLSWNGDVDIKGKKILFVDDLITTGSTARECCKLIKKHGAKEVKILTIARTIFDKKGAKT